MAERELSDFLTGYLKYTENSEPPIAYHTWTGISIIAGALQRKVYLNWGFEEIFPNMYIVLVGPSGRARKGVAMGIGQKILQDVPGVTMTCDSNTREALIAIQKRAIKDFEDGTTGEIKFHCSVTAFAEELSVFLGQNDIKFLANLTQWYNSKDEWAHETKGTGRDSLRGLCFNLEGATAPDWIQSMLPQEAVGGGFTSRVIFIVEDGKGKTIPKGIQTEENKRLEEALKRDLERISYMSGAFTMDPEAEKLYTDWYVEQDNLAKAGQMAVADPRFAGYCERRATHIRKLLMIMSASRSDELIICKEDFHRSLKVLKAAELKMYKTFGGLGQAKYSSITEMIKDYIQAVKIATRSDILRKFRRDCDTGTLRIVEEVLSQMKVISIKRVPGREGDNVYEWIGEENV